mmetsp:Transcript_2109/g.4081  ORF Transcript_2109/g.4081 Transcript_2109/m.4081 type:complete len:223 (-) Transcript_2109:195-863(-)
MQFPIQKALFSTRSIIVRCSSSIAITVFATGIAWRKEQSRRLFIRMRLEAKCSIRHGSKLNNGKRVFLAIRTNHYIMLQIAELQKQSRNLIVRVFVQNIKIGYAQFSRRRYGFLRLWRSIHLQFDDIRATVGITFHSINAVINEGQRSAYSNHGKINLLDWNFFVALDPRWLSILFLQNKRHLLHMLGSKSSLLHQESARQPFIAVEMTSQSQRTRRIYRSL